MDVIALAEPDAQRREEAVRRAPAAVAVADYRTVLDSPDVEAVVICLPTAMHADVAIAALQAGKHVYLEKPLAASCAEGLQVLEARRQAGVVGMVGFNYRFHAFYQAARRHIQSGRLGEIVAVRTVFSSAPRLAPAWKQTRTSGGGVLLDYASHHVDLLSFLFDQPIAEAYADVRSLRSEDDTASVQLRLENGVPVQSLFAFGSADDDRFEIYGQSGKLTVDRQRGWNAVVTPAARGTSRADQARDLLRSLAHVASSPYLRARMLAPSNEPSFQASLEHFAAVVRNRSLPYPDFDDGYRSLAVIEAAEESARARHPVRVSDLVLQ
jgi:predicted dehydrogenase